MWDRATAHRSQTEWVGKDTPYLRVLIGIQEPIGREVLVV